MKFECLIYKWKFLKYFESVLSYWKPWHFMRQLHFHCKGRSCLYNPQILIGSRDIYSVIQLTFVRLLLVSVLAHSFVATPRPVGEKNNYKVWSVFMSKQKGCWVRGAGRENFSRHFELHWEVCLRSRGLQDRMEPLVCSRVAWRASHSGVAP